MANPAWVSVPLVGWSHSQALSRHADVHLVTHSRNRASILEAGLVESRDFTALDAMAVERPVWRVIRRLRGGENHAWTLATASESFLYYFFERRVWRRFGGAIRSGAYDLVHRLTPLTPTAQSPITGPCRAAGVPFVLGPLNGGLRWPQEFSREIRREGDWLTYVRWGHKLMPYYRSARLNAAAILAGSRATYEQIPAWAQPKVVYVPENGIEPGKFDRFVERPAQQPLSVAFVGRLVPYKGADMLLEAAAPLIRENRVAVDIIGDGPEWSRLQAMAAAADAGAGRVRFRGWIRHDALPQCLAESDVLCFPSIREFGGAVVLEAMALGLAPIVVDYGGPGEHVSPTTGVAVRLAPRPQIVAQIRAALELFAAHPETARAVGRRARQRVLSLYTWDAKARQMLEVWRWVLGQRDKPDFGMPLEDR
jgi:alpha-maltose-1-phosphate synthase